MQSIEPVVRASVFEGFDAFLGKRGVTLAPLLSAEGIEPATLENPLAEIPVAAVAKVFERAALAAGDPCIGLTWAESLRIGGAGIVGYIVLNSPSVRHALENLARYGGLLTHPIEVHFEEQAEIGVLYWTTPATPTPARVQYPSFLMGRLINRLRAASHAQWDPVLVELAHRPLDCPDRAHRVLGPHIGYNAARYAVHLDTPTLDRQFADADPLLLAIMKRFAEQLLPEVRERGGVVAEARMAIITSLEKGHISLIQVAETMGLTPRTLQSRLAHAETSYEALLNDVRKAAAERYLRDTDLPLTEIAYLLGFSELSVFTRAAQRWFRDTPSAIRVQLRQ
ncbi:MAG: AraC family transcriptional regulator ligand-binding domain-containing protein [Hyphomicrobium sp.]